MKVTVRIITSVSICGLFFLLDRFFKFQALHDWSAPRLVNRWFGWQPFFNSGAAFGLPIPNWVIIILTVPILALILLVILNHELRIKNFAIVHNSSFLILIFSGALSNLIDRVVYGYTIDYLRFITGVFNLADILILAGFIIWYQASRRKEIVD